MMSVDQRPLRFASGMGGKETSGSAAPPPRAPRPPRAPILHSPLESSAAFRESWHLLVERLKHDNSLRTRVLDYLCIAGLVVVFVLGAYILAVG